MTHYRNPFPLLPKIIIAGIITAIIMLLVDFLVYGMIAPEYFKVPGMKEMPDMPMMIVGYVIGGLLFAYVLGRLEWHDKDGHHVFGSKYAHSFGFGALIALVIFLPNAFFNISLFEGRELTPALVDVAYRIILFGLLAIVVIMLYPVPKEGS